MGIKLILCMLADIGLKVYAVPSWPTSLTLSLRSKTLKFYVKAFTFKSVFNCLLLEQLDGSS